MASSRSTFSLAPSLPMKIVSYVPPVRKHKPKSKANTKATTRTAGYNLSKADSFKDGGEWFDIDDFPMPDCNASRSFDPGVPAPSRDADSSGSLDQDVVGSLDVAPFLEKPEHYQLGRDSPDGGTDHATSIAKTNSAMNGLVDGSSPEFPLLLEGDVAEERYSTTHVEPSNGASEYRENGFYAAASNEGYRTGQHDELDAAGMCAPSVEDIEGIRHERSPAADELLFGDISVTSRPSLTRKRTDPSSADTIISSAEVPDVTSEPEPEDTRSAKRRRPAKQRAESLILDPVSTPKSTPLRTPSGPVSRSRASNEPGPSPLGSDSKSDGAGTPGQFPNDLLEENVNDGAHARGTVEELLHSPKQSISLEETEGDQYIDADSNRREHNRDGESRDDEANQVDEVSGRPLTKSSRRCKRTVPPVRKRCRGPSRTAPRRRDYGTLHTRASRQVTSSQSRLLSTPRMDIATRSCSPQTSSPGTKAGDGSNINHGSSANMSYQTTDLTLYPVPKGSSVVTAIIRYRGSKLSPNPMSLDQKLLGGEGKVIRMTQLSPDSWMLLGYRYDDGAPGAYTRESSKLLNADWMSSARSDAASHDTNHPDDTDEEYEEDPGEYRPHAAGSGQRLSKEDMRFRKRTYVPWLESDEERLLSYKDKMSMDWDEVISRFPGRSAGAVKLRYYTLRKKGS